jgi:transposase
MNHTKTREHFPSNKAVARLRWDILDAIRERFTIRQGETPYIKGNNALETDLLIQFCEDEYGNEIRSEQVVRKALDYLVRYGYITRSERGWVREPQYNTYSPNLSVLYIGQWYSASDYFYLAQQAREASTK